MYDLICPFCRECEKRSRRWQWWGWQKLTTRITMMSVALKAIVLILTWRNMTRAGHTSGEVTRWLIRHDTTTKHLTCQTCYSSHLMYFVQLHLMTWQLRVTKKKSVKMVTSCVVMYWSCRPGTLVAEADPNEEGEMIARALERSVVFRGINKRSLKEVGIASPRHGIISFWPSAFGREILFQKLEVLYPHFVRGRIGDNSSLSGQLPRTLIGVFENCP
jgi:hypothetical protein